MLTTRAAQTFALLVHELTTNACKHGALSQSEGRVAVEWFVKRETDSPCFRFILEREQRPPRRGAVTHGFWNEFAGAGRRS